MTSVVRFNAEAHYMDVASWWKEEGWPVMPLNFLSANGLVCYWGDEPAMAAWVYRTDSDFCLFEFIVANPKIRKDKRANCFRELFKSGKILAKEMGFKTMLVMARNDSLISRLEKEKFEIADEGMTHLTFNLEAFDG